MSTRPLADEIRPQSLDEVVGQRHLIGPGGVLRRLIVSNCMCKAISSAAGTYSSGII